MRILLLLVVVATVALAFSPAGTSFCCKQFCRSVHGTELPLVAQSKTCVYRLGVTEELLGSKLKLQ